MSKVSVIIPAYNVEKYIYKCVESVINQTLEDIEIVIVNDGSTDNTLTLINEISKRDNRIKVISQSNKGLSEARNAGLKYVSSKYVIFLDSDDWIDSNMLEIMYNKAEINKCDIIQCNYITDYNGYRENIKQNIEPNIIIDENNKRILKEKIISGNIVTYSWDKMYRLEFLNKHNIKFKPIPRFEDWYFIVEAITKCNRFMFIPNHLYYYRIVSGSLSKKYCDNYEELIINLQSTKLNYMKEWNMNGVSDNKKFIISLGNDILKLVNYIFDENNNQNSIRKYKRLKYIYKNNLVKRTFNKTNTEYYLLNCDENNRYTRMIFSNISKGNYTLVYILIFLSKFILK